MPAAGKQAPRVHRFTRPEQIANGVTHGLGALAAVAGLAVLAVLASARGDAWCVVGVSVFGATLVILYSASTALHTLAWTRFHPALRSLDHAAIYLLIAGSYTPWMLVNLRGAWGWSILGTVWGLALTGIAAELTWPHSARQRRASLVLYLGMGWTVVVATGPVVSSVAPLGLLLILLGGLAYTAGVPFYLWRSLKYHHAVWHLFVLAGSTLHYLAVLWFVIPPGAGAP